MAHFDFADLRETATPMSEGGRKSVVTLAKGDSAWNAGSTKRHVFGPGTLTTYFFPEMVQQYLTD